MSNLRVSEIYIYPIKSLGGIRVRAARVLAKGLEMDRRWMLVDRNNVFLTQRINPMMALFQLSMEKDGLIVTHRGSSLEVPFQAGGGETLRARVWDDEVNVVSLSAQIDAWFSTRLGMDCRLVSFPEESPRPVDPAYAIGNNHVSLADGYPILLVGQSSLDDLNARLREPVFMNRFRPNIVVTGGLPFEEDSWRNIRIGSGRYVGVKPCARCVLTTVDQTTGEKGTEPLATLSSFRKNGSKVLFGQNVIPQDFKYISENDEVVIE